MHFNVTYKGLFLGKVYALDYASAWEKAKDLAESKVKDFNEDHLDCDEV